MADPIVTQDVTKARVWMDAKWHKIVKWVNGVAGALLAANWAAAKDNLPNIEQYVPAHLYHAAAVVVSLATFGTMVVKGQKS